MYYPASEGPGIGEADVARRPTARPSPEVSHARSRPQDPNAYREGHHGTVSVPASALWGAQTARAVENFPSPEFREPRALVDATARIKLAAARVNARLGLLPRRKARALERAAREVLAGRMQDQFVVDAYQAGAGTSFHMNVNEVLANRAAEILGRPAGATARWTRTTTPTWPSRPTTSSRPPSGSPPSSSRPRRWPRSSGSPAPWRERLGRGRTS